MVIYNQKKFHRKAKEVPANERKIIYYDTDIMRKKPQTKNQVINLEIIETEKLKDDDMKICSYTIQLMIQLSKMGENLSDNVMSTLPEFVGDVPESFADGFLTRRIG